MARYTTRFSDFFSPIEQNALVRFCKQINATDADIIVLMAHKAVRLFEVLVEQEYIADSVAGKLVISNHAIEFDGRYMEGKKIMIVDDIVISGSSISDLVCNLLSMGVREEDISIITIATDLKYFAMNFEDPNGNSSLYSGNEMQDAACIELSSKISKVFSQYGIPYEVDFPMYTCTTESDEVFNLLHDSFLWTIYDVSNENQRIAHVSAYSVQLAHCVREELWKTIGVDLDKCTHLCIRCYIKRFPNKTASCCFLPLCLFEEITEGDLVSVYEKLKPETEILRYSKAGCAKAQMRYVQFYIAHQLFAVFQRFCKIAAEVEGPSHRDTVLLFGPAAGQIVFDLLNKPLPNSKNVHAQILRREYLAEVRVKEYQESKRYRAFSQDATKINQKWPAEQNFRLNRLVLDPFLWWYDSEELPAREKIRKGEYHYIKDSGEIKKTLSRLNNGVSFAALRKMISEQFSNVPCEEIEAIISLFLDRGIDEGIIVPAVFCGSNDTTSRDEGERYLCRIYRHGEDLPFAKADEYRLLYFLYRLAAEIPDIAQDEEKNIIGPGISQVALQKMIVLFYRMGLAQGGIFNRFLGLGDCKILHSFMCVHGAVAGFTDFDKDPTMFVAQEDRVEYITLLSKWLREEQKILISRSQSAECADKYADKNIGGPNTVCTLSTAKLSTLVEEGKSVLGGEVKQRIEKIVDIIAQWWKAVVQNGQQGRFKDQATAVTSCGDIYIYAAAIATEVHYFKLFWENQANEALHKKNAEEICYIFQNAQDTQEDENDSKKRKYIAEITQGLNSGRDKVKWFKEGAATICQDEVSKLLDSDLKNLWLSTWSNYDPRFSKATEQFHREVSKIEGYLFFYLACLECIRSKEFWETGKLPDLFEELKDNCISHSDIELGTAITSLLSAAGGNPGTVHERGKNLYERVNTILMSSEETVTSIQDAVREHAPNYTVHYKSALIFEVSPLDRKAPDKILTSYWESFLPENAEKTEINIIRLPKQKGTSFERYGVFCNSTGAMEENEQLSSYKDHSQESFQRYTDKLYAVFEGLCKRFSGQAYEVRGILIPHIPINYYFEHNLQRDINKNAEKFCQRVVQPLERLYLCEDNPTKRLVFVCCNYRETLLHVLPSLHLMQGVAIPPGWCSKCEVYGSEVSTSNDTNIDIAAHSLVRISCSGIAGWGFLLRLQDRVVCITCNHVIRKYCKEKAPIRATVAVNPTIQFNLEPVTHIPNYEEPPKLRPANQEVAVLQPCWNGDIPLNIYNIVTKDHLQKEQQKTKNAKCRISIAVGERIRWKQVPMPMGEAGLGYEQIDEAKHVKCGDSGGIYTTLIKCASPVIFGMHVGVYGDQLDDQENAKKSEKPSCFMLPSKVILHILNGVEKDGKRNKN